MDTVPITRMESDRLLLRRPIHEDLVHVFEIHSDPETNRFNPSGPHLTMEKSRETLSAWISHWEEHGFGYWTVIRKDDSTVVGFGGFKLERIESSEMLSLYYRFRPSAWGSGFATEMSAACIKHMKSTGCSIPIVAIINPQNIPSIKVAERLGMQLDREIFYEIPSQLFILPQR